MTLYIGIKTLFKPLLLTCYPVHCLIVDDNTKTAAGLKELLAGTPGVEQVYKAVQPYLVRSLMAIEPVEVIFIRTRLWDFKVFEQLPTAPTIVFLTGGRDKITTQAGFTVPYCLREPYTKHDLHVLVKHISSEHIIEPVQYFFVRQEGKFHRIFFDRIEMIERMRLHYVRLWTKDFSLLINGTLSQLLRQLPEDQFVRASDTLVLPRLEMGKIEGDSYMFRGRAIPLTFRFAAMLRKEMEQQSNWSDWPSD